MSIPSKYQNIMKPYRIIAKCVETHPIEYCLNNYKSEKTLPKEVKCTSGFNYKEYIKKVKQNI